MKAVVYREKGVFSLENRPCPQLKEPGDALVRVTLASICTSDLHIKNGAVPRAVQGVVVGHELVGEVVKTGSAVKGFVPGDRVAVNVETFCGSCFYCKNGFVNNCTDPQGGWSLGCRIDGGQAEYVRVPFAEQGLSHIPEDVCDEQALLVGDVLATGYWSAQIADIQKDGTVAVIGAGPVGLCAMMCAKLYAPSHIVAVDKNERRLTLAKEEGWADQIVNPLKQDAGEALRALTGGRGADCVIEAAGGKDTFQTAWQLARPNATVVIAALYEEPQLLPLPEMYGKNLTFKTGGVDANACEQILRLIKEGRLDTTKLITHTYPLERVMEAYELFESGEDGVIKVAIVP